MAKERCPYCGTLYVTDYYGTRYGPEREVEDHSCSAYPAHLPTVQTPSDTSFIRDARNSAEGLAHYRREQ